METGHIKFWLTFCEGEYYIHRVEYYIAYTGTFGKVKSEKSQLIWAL
jgi:hypothetical protein